MEKEKFNKIKYNAKYNAAHYVRRELSFKIEEDKEILEKLDSEKSMSQYVKRLIKEDIERSKQKSNG